MHDSYGPPDEIDVDGRASTRIYRVRLKPGLLEHFQFRFNDGWLSNADYNFEKE
jgi:hypothetical protein